MSTQMKFVLGGNTLQFEEGASYPANRPIEKMQVSDRTSAGTLKVETLGITLRRRQLVFQDMIKTDYDALRNWFDNIANASEFEFEFTDERGDTGTVKIIDNIFEFTETDFELFNGTLTLEYQ